MSGEGGTTALEPLLLTVREACRLLRMARPKVYELLRRGTLDGAKIGGDWRVRRESVERLTGPIPRRFFEEGR